MANGFLSDGKGDSSSGRLIGFLVVLCVLSVWAIVCWFKRDMIDIPLGVLGVLGVFVSTLGFLLGHKGVEDETFVKMTGKGTTDAPG